MKIILIDNTELNPILVTGGPRFIQGQNRDTLNFIFSATEDINVLENININIKSLKKRHLPIIILLMIYIKW